MRIAKIVLKGFRAFKSETVIGFGSFATLVGKNDCGKSSILHALAIFFNNGNPDDDDFNRDQEPDSPIVIQVAFSGLPDEIQIEEGVDTDFRTECLVDPDGLLAVRKTFRRKGKKPVVSYFVEDFVDDNFRNLCSFKESELNEKGKALGLDFRKSGAGITNKSKREAIRRVAVEQKINKALIEIEPKEAAEKLQDYLPEFSLFRADESLNEEATAFQKEFKAVVETAIAGIPGKSDIESGVESVIDREVQTIQGFLSQHTDEVASIKARPTFKWKDLVSFTIECQDKQGKAITFAKRGSGLRRLLMVAYFQYLAQRRKNPASLKPAIYGIEEPETYLHPGAQRSLLASLREVSVIDQVLLTSHSSVFAGSTDIDNLILVTRDSGVSDVKQGASLELSEVAEELGVEPSDQIYGFKAVVFVEGPGDCEAYSTIAKTLYEDGKLSATLESKRIGLLSGGGDNLKHWVTRRAIEKISRRYAVVLDSDGTSEAEPVSRKALALKGHVEEQGGKCIILRKREIENYLHRDVLKTETQKEIELAAFTDVKSIVGRGVKLCGLFARMNAQQILDSDKYEHGGQERHELVELLSEVLELAS